MTESKWTVWRNRRGKVKGIAIVFRAADIGLELHSDLADEGDREDLCREMCDQLNELRRKRAASSEDSNIG